MNFIKKISFFKNRDLLSFIVFFGFLFVVFSQNTVSQKYTYKRYSLQEGLPQIQTTHIMQDHQGYLWVSHWNGISKFNGYTFTNFSKQDGLSGITAFHSIEFEPNKIAVIGFYGLAIGNEEGFIQYPFLKNLKGDRNAYIYSTEKGLVITNVIDRKTWKRIHLFFDFETHSFREILKIAGEFVEEVVVKKGKIEVYFKNHCDVIKLADFKKVNTHYWQRKYDDFAISPKGEIWAYSAGKKRMYKIKNERGIVKENPTNIMIYTMNTTQRFNTFAITINDQVVWYDNAYRLFISDIQKTENTGVQFNLIRNFFTDREGNMWLATEQGMYNFFKFRFMTTKIFPNNVSDMIWSVTQTQKGEMLFASANKGLYKIKDKKTQKIVAKKGNTEEANRFYMGAVKSKKGNVYIPYRNGILCWGAEDEISRTRLNSSPEMLINSKFSDTIFGAIGGGLLVVTPKGVYKQITKDFAHYQNESIAQDKYGNLWLGATASDFVQIYNGKKVTQWKHKDANHIISMATDKKQHIWLGNHKGLFVYNYDTIKRFAPNVIDMPVYTIASYTDSLLVLGTPKNLFVINIDKYYQKGKEVVYKYDNDNGFTAEEMIQNSYCIDKEGGMWFPAMNYCYRFFPSELHQSENVKKPILRIFNGKNKLLRGGGNNTILNTKNNVKLRFSFISIAFNSQKRITYRYRLQGYEQKWNSTSGRNATYTELPSGDYIFEVQASVNGANWSKSTYSQNIKIPKKISETFLFKLLVPIVVGVLIFIFSKKYYDQKRKKAIIKQKQEHEIINLQLANIKSQLNPHFIFNVMNGIGSDLIQSTNEITYTSYSNMCELIRKSMEHAQTPIKTIVEEFEFVNMYLQLQKYRFNDKFTYKLHIGNGVDTQFLIPKMCLQILVENVIKHVVEKENKKIIITISIHKEGNDLVLLVKDNGSGFEKENTTGKGLQGIRKMLKIYNKYNIKNAVLHIQSNTMGSKVKMTIPNSYSFLLTTLLKPKNQ